MLKIVGLLNLRDFVSLCSVSPSALADIERIGSRFLSFFADLLWGLRYNIKIMCTFAVRNNNNQEYEYCNDAFTQTTACHR